jgi:hypothetical protein
MRKPPHLMHGINLGEGVVPRKQGPMAGKVNERSGRKVKELVGGSSVIEEAANPSIRRQNASPGKRGRMLHSAFPVPPGKVGKSLFV